MQQTEKRTADQFQIFYKDPTQMEVTFDRVSEDQIPFIHADALLAVCDQVETLQRRIARLDKAAVATQMASKARTVKKTQKKTSRKAPAKKAPIKKMSRRASPKEMRAHH